MKLGALLLVVSPNLFAVEPPTDFEATAFSGRVELFWTPPADPDYVGCVILRSDGEFVYAGNGIHLVGVQSDRGLQNGRTYHYTIVGIDADGNTSTPVSASAIPKERPEASNLLTYGRFDDGLTGWQAVQPEGSYERVALSPPLRGVSTALRMRGSETVASHLLQETEDLEPETLYTLSIFCLGSSPEMAPSFSVDGAIQKEQEYYCCPSTQIATLASARACCSTPSISGIISARDDPCLRCSRRICATSLTPGRG